ncbi:ArsR/SmtB family transcription factor [Mesorhizobium sp. NPDC059054]|uniref:ArsR/SmtB family transcription factor n=1 Tax=unclassified Mesorhizobium TaxID=325217 RepID=UPI0006C76327|nr:helix-turn-helix domain-containing protein [Mesorhizobium sp. 1M-11]
MTLPHPTTDQISLPLVLSVLGDPTRLAIVAHLAHREGGKGRMNCSQFLALGSKTNLSYHLAKLREAGVTRTEVVGTQRFLTLRREDLDQRFPGLLDSIVAGVEFAAIPKIEESVEMA